MFVRGFLLAVVAVFAAVLLVKVLLALAFVAVVALCASYALAFVRRLSMRSGRPRPPRLRNVSRVAPLTKPSISIR